MSIDSNRHPKTFGNIGPRGTAAFAYAPLTYVLADAARMLNRNHYTIAAALAFYRALSGPDAAALLGKNKTYLLFLFSLAVHAYAWARTRSPTRRPCTRLLAAALAFLSVPSLIAIFT